MADGVTIKDVEVCKAGTWTDANGQDVTITEADLVEMAQAYDPALQEAPAVVGHPKMADPQYGTLVNLRTGKGDDGEPVLLADIEDVDPDFAETIKAKRFKRRSLAFLPRNARSNPKPGKLYPLHLGFLGAKAPAVKGLKPIQFAGLDDATVIELASPRPWVFRSLAAVLGRVRDHFVETLGVEKADAIISGWAIDDLRNAAADMEAEDAPHPVAFSAPPNPEEHMPDDNDLAARQAALDVREADLAKREKALADRVALMAAEADERFVDQLIADGRLRPTAKADTLTLLAALDDEHQVVMLSAGDDGKPAQVTPRAAYRAQLQAQPKLVELGEHKDPGGPGAEGAVHFAAPDGYVVDPHSLQLHSKVVAYQAAHPGTDYAAALRAVAPK